MLLNEIVDFLDSYLEIDKYPDPSVNGLQVEGSEDVEKVAFAVDASLESFTKAVENDADMIVCHHGMVWNGIKRVQGYIKERLKFLFENDLSLYAVHLPLDAHREIGNNAMILRSIGVEPEERFGKYNGFEIGYMGRGEYEFRELLKIFKERFGKINYLKFGEDKIEKIAVISGRGSFAIGEASVRGVDLLITGEIEHSAYHIAKDCRINVIFLGHYNSETIGLKALMNVVRDELNIDVVFLDIPTEL